MPSSFCPCLIVIVHFFQIPISRVIRAPNNPPLLLFKSLSYLLLLSPTTTTTTTTTKTTLAAPSAATTPTRTAATAQYLQVVEYAARPRFKVKCGEGERDAVVFWCGDDVNTAQSVSVVVGEVGGLYGARQWRKRSTTRWSDDMNNTEWRNIQARMIIVLNSGDQLISPSQWVNELVGISNGDHNATEKKKDKESEWVSEWVNYSFIHSYSRIMILDRSLALLLCPCYK